MIAGIIGGGLGLLLALAAGLFWIWMLVDALTNKRLSDGEKIAWVLVIIFVSFLGAIIYFFVGRSKRLAA